MKEQRSIRHSTVLLAICALSDTSAQLGLQCLSSVLLEQLPSLLAVLMLTRVMQCYPENTAVQLELQ